MTLSMPDLPGDIIVEILSRLPIKSLLRFRCVSNPWRNLISSPNFAKLHLKRTSDHNADIDHHSVLISSLSQFKSITYNPSESYDNKDLKIELPTTTYPNPEIRVFGSCNGLIYFEVDEVGQILWNPSTREYKVLPEPGFPKNKFASCGFGFDASIDDYKVVIRSYGDIHKNVFANPNNSIKIEVFTLKTNTWRRIQDFGHFIFQSFPGTLFNGALHWIQWGSNVSERKDDAIIYFDLAQEQYGELGSLPPDNGEKKWFSGLGVSQGCIYFHRCNVGALNELWVMKEYGVKSSWSKLFSISTESISYNYYFDPLCILKNGEVLVNLDGRKLMRYNIKGNTLRLIRDGHDIQSVVYEESLVSLN